MVHRRLLSALFLGCSTILTCVLPCYAEEERLIPSLPAALASLPASGTPVRVAWDNVKLPVGGHLQGIQTRYDAHNRQRLVILSHDSVTAGYLAVFDLPADTKAAPDVPGRLRSLTILPSDGNAPPLRHAGGFQLCGSVLAVGVEDNQAKLRSQIQFWETADPDRLQQLTHLTIARENKTPKLATAGAVGLVQLGDDFLLAVGNWDCRSIEFYRSNGKPLADPECRFEPAATWQAAEAATADWQPDTNRGTYQAINLLRDAVGGLYLLGFDTTTTGQDVVDLFAVDLTLSPPQVLCKVARREVALTGDNHFRYAGGASDGEGRLLILASPRSFQVPGKTVLNVLGAGPAETPPAKQADGG